MLKKTSSLLMAVVCTFITFSQLSIVEFTSKNSNLYTSARHEGEKRGIPSTVYEFNPAMLERVGDKYIIRLESKTPFTCFGIGWKTTGMNRPAGDFKINFALEKQLKDKTFGESKSAEGDVHPTETETGMYWSELMFGYDEDARKYLYLELIVPNDVQIEKIRIDVMDLSGDVGTVFNKAPDENIQKSGACPPAPTIIQRAQWCGTYTACTNASYTPTVINPTHVVMHHGASPNTYTDGYAVVRSYWNYHVNTLAWSDIGYNYLIDKFGNVFLGRKNANYLTQDVRGSHAGNSNGASIGVNFLGNGDVTQPTPIQLEKLYDLLGWWFNSRNINITSAANITLQSGGTANLQRFVGHKDVNIGGTACPGTVIYDLLPSIRTQVVSLINGCTSAPTTASNLQRTVGACPQNNVSFSWSGSGSGWYIQISNSSSFSSPYIKYVSNLTSFTGPTGFVLQSNMTTPLTFSAGQTYYWRIFDNTSFVTGPSFTINPVPAQAAAISGTSAVCSGSSNTYSIAAVTGATSYTWSVPTGSTITAGQGTTSITVTAGVTAGNISVSASNACGTGTARTLAVTSNAVPAQAAAISGTSAVCSGSSNTYSIAAVTGATSYTWSVPAGSTITAGQGTTSITVTAGSTAGNIAVSASNACGTGTARTLAVTSNAVPAQAAAISGTSAVCSGSSNSYSIAAVTGATSYTWTAPVGSTITAGQGTTSITVTAGSTAGNIAVSASNACGTGTARTLAITSNAVPAQPTAITGTSAICNGSSNTYSIAAVTGATSYTWTVPTGSTITAGQGTTSITVTAGVTAGNITVSASNACGTGTARTLAITSNVVPAQPTAITGTSAICNGSSNTYSIAAVAGATSYTWSVPAGSTITAGQGTTSITVTAGATAGNITVSASNACGTGTARTLAITSNTVPAQPTAITGTSAICNGSSNTYSIAAVTGATSYTWSVPTGSTITAGQGTTSITVTAGSTAGNITVSASNVCGTGTTRTLAVTSNALPAQPTAITGTSSVCAGSSSTYSIAAVTGATSYTWTVPAGSTITAGQGTTSITVTAGSTAGNIAVSAGNACGTGTARTLAVTLSTCADVTRPTTNVANPSWVTTDFTASFTDTENAGGSGLQYRFYQVIDKTGNEWRANKNDGFFNDNFEGTAINTDWNLVSGTWSVANGILSQNDQANANSNLYFAIPQVTSSQYLYNWKMKISGTGTNRRAGLHFFCDNATLSNRGNSYMVFFRADGNVAQVYEYLNNTMYLRASAACTVTPGVSYDYKVVLNPATGEINVYQNDVFIVSWTDTTPLTVGNHVSLRTADCAVEYDDIRILKSRTTAATVTAGNSTTKQIRYQNASSSSPSGKIVSIVTDVAKNISAESSSLVNLDFWGPFTVGTVNDGLAADIASQTSTTSLSANWTATSDANNTISHYSYAIGTSPGATNVVAWTNNGLNLSFTRTGLALTVGTTYYVSVRAHNIANLVSSVRTSNGVIISGAKMGEVSDLPENSFEDRDVIVYPNPVSDFLYLNRVDKDASLEIIDISGKVHEVEVLENEIPTLQVATLPSGTYFIRITQKGEVQVKKFVKK